MRKIKHDRRIPTAYCPTHCTVLNSIVINCTLVMLCLHDAIKHTDKTRAVAGFFVQRTGVQNILHAFHHNRCNWGWGRVGTSTCVLSLRICENLTGQGSGPPDSTSQICHWIKQLKTLLATISWQFHNSFGCLIAAFIRLVSTSIITVKIILLIVQSIDLFVHSVLTVPFHPATVSNRGKVLWGDSCLWGPNPKHHTLYTMTCTVKHSTVGTTLLLLQYFWNL